MHQVLHLIVQLQEQVFFHGVLHCHDHLFLHHLLHEDLQFEVYFLLLSVIYYKMISKSTKDEKIFKLTQVSELLVNKPQVHYKSQIYYLFLIYIPLFEFLRTGPPTTGLLLSSFLNVLISEVANCIFIARPSSGTPLYCFIAFNASALLSKTTSAVPFQKKNKTKYNISIIIYFFIFLNIFTMLI